MEEERFESKDGYIKFEESDFLMQVGGESVISLWSIARAMKLPHFASLLDNFLNLGGKQYPEGYRLGKMMRFTHRTLQRCLFAFCLGIIAGLSEQQFTDPRNETAIASAKKLKEMIEDGTLSAGLYL